MLDILAHHPSTAKFISKKLAMRFVSDNPPQSLIDRMADAFLSKDGDIREVLRTMFRSPEFWGTEAYRAKVKTPLEFVASAVRAQPGRRTRQPLRDRWPRSRVHRRSWLRTQISTASSLINSYLAAPTSKSDARPALIIPQFGAKHTSASIGISARQMTPLPHAMPLAGQCFALIRGRAGDGCDRRLLVAIRPLRGRAPRTRAGSQDAGAARSAPRHRTGVART